MSLYLIEGIDRSGKSSLAEALTSTSGEVRHFSAPRSDDPIEEYVVPLLDYRPTPEPLVCDRGHVGEAVWPRFFGRASIMTEPQYRWIELFMQSRGAVAVHTTRGLDGLRRAFAEADPPEPLPVDRIEEAMQAYDLEYERNVACGTFLYDHEQREELVPRLADLADQMARYVEPGVRISTRWIGSHRPIALYVAAPSEDIDLPVECGEAFEAVLDTVGAHWPMVAVTSAAGRELRDLWSYLGQPQCVPVTPRSVRACVDQEILPRLGPVDG